MKRMVICLAASALVYFVAAARTAEGPKADEQVRIDNFSFIPETLTVKAGTTVTWVNMDDVPHTVVSTARKFSSKVLDTDDQYGRVFSEKGTFEYYCSVHPHMKGKVIVQ